MKYLLLALMATILVPSGGHTQEQSVKIPSITNGQQLLVEVEQHGRAVRLACLQAPRFRQEPWAEFAQSQFWRVMSHEVIRHLLSFDQGGCMGAWWVACL